MKERLLLFIVFLIIILISSVFYSGKKKDLEGNVNTLKNRYQKIAMLEQRYLNLLEIKKSKGPALKKGLLSYIQGASSSIGMSKNIASIKPVPGNKEIVDVIYEKLNLKQVIRLFKIINSHSNLGIKKFSITKRFDNPKYANINLQIEKIR